MKPTIVFMCLSALLCVACQQKKAKNYNTSDAASSPEIKPMVDTIGEKFIKDAYQSALYQNKLSEIAITKSSDRELKNLSEACRGDDYKIALSIAKTADSLKIITDTILSKKQVDAISELNNKTGVEFDKAYVKYMLRGYQGSLSDNLQYANKSLSSSIKSVFVEIGPVWRQNYERFRKINKKIKASVDPGAITEGMETMPLK